MSDLHYLLNVSILKITFFPFLNILGVTIAIAVGVDDTFILIHFFEEEKQSIENKIVDSNMKSDLLIDDAGNKENEFDFYNKQMKISIIRQALKRAFNHSAIAMFVTSTTTAAAFFTNYFSSIMLLKCFGVFAGIAILTNYLFTQMEKEGAKTKL
uniref:SSD domain-containing protein n=1 Tax=Acrobeloides nanus TaxID=290746 RepID=A0A914BY23_9BILA